MADRSDAGEPEQDADERPTVFIRETERSLEIFGLPGPNDQQANVRVSEWSGCRAES